MITCVLRYEVDADKLEDFEAYARRWIDLLPRFGGVHHGYFLPHEGANDIALALFSFPSLAAYERYRAVSADDPDCRAAYRFARETRCIRRYDRQFLRPLLAAAGD
ncbi:NIPSNAP family protein [Roseicyclus persicicus]|uniref:NIPSNAP family protein n=1 Tax=Roseicyclus persicicus TaxID=2650661 RepID=A0A7X6GYB2_9RHOB|nr:NIPSNAP family protein [Roseibacterium persicicum]NKX44642.1 NIPSNAP family protein [Roseibacterium persicicum]